VIINTHTTHSHKQAHAHTCVHTGTHTHTHTHLRDAIPAEHVPALRDSAICASTETQATVFGVVVLIRLGLAVHVGAAC
jgi:3-dehydroquinate dehydratase